MATNGAMDGKAATNGHTTHNLHPHITLYTNHRCPFAHRAHIALNELNLPFEEVIIDLDTPRPQWYLDINPRGLVPAIKYSVPGVVDGEILYESGIVARFLCDSFPSHLLPASKETPWSALRRAKIDFFVDTFSTKISSYQFAAMRASGEERDAKCKEWAAAIEKEIEPLLSDAAPFFGGSKELTFAEVMTAPFVIRWRSLAKDGELLPTSFLGALDKLPNFSRWSKAMAEKDSVLKIYDEPAIVQGTKAKVQQMMAKK
ncbi:thioredoxin-like protein [Hortaea werneckii]|uniref:GST N-terminal domain-containing protein n=1 Tax=Hortaea werneckii TaxID=91943 RepID=A0A3M7I755_HORWE|nr:thioredoxin-like protein [Hortaea werneckii]KAI6994651.1 thioredoxin-like protein [Hortaea werneckii]KAI7047254.1 thioredoxin-like protein [Hortaea werneckii]KAI7078198.1 thioredoxin-like protein [Hortaea werneckii]KAI7089296.1 thioredoxin-like protein [Hortaea werneckii]